MKKTIVIGLIIALILVVAFALNEKFKLKSPEPLQQPRHVISVSDPSDYNETDLLNFAEQGIDIHNWATWYGGKMTPYRYPNGSFYLSEDQKQLIVDLYNKEQTIFWIGVTTDHITFIFEDPYEDTANAIKAYTDFFAEAGLCELKVGTYIPIWHDEIITRQRENMTWQEQYDLAETARAEINSRLNWMEWYYVKWTITGQDFMVHDNLTYQLSNDAQSYWAHHTDVTTPEEAEDLVYHHNFSVMADEEWKAIWGRWGKFAWTDGSLVDGEKGSRKLTELGEDIFD